MNHGSVWTKVALLTLALAIGLPRSAPAATRPAKTIKLTGYVIDSACAFVKDLKKPISEECATTCAKSGSPLVIMAQDGTVYLPISDTTPATGQNERLMEYAGKRVSVIGKVYEKGGSRAVVIEKVEAAPAGK
jgi:hypothetical protein